MELEFTRIVTAWLSKITAALSEMHLRFWSMQRSSRYTMQRPRRNTSKSARSGFALLEIMVALTLLAVVLTPLAAMIFRITSQSHTIVGASYRNAVLLDEINYFESLPYDSLTTGTTTSTVSAQPYPRTVSVTIAETWQHAEARMKTIRVIIRPDNQLYKPDTAFFARTTLKASSLFNDTGG